MSSFFNDGTVTWELINIGNSGSGSGGGGGSVGSMGSVEFTSADWLPNGDNYELTMQAGQLPIAVIDSNNESLLFDVSGNRIVIGAPIDGRYYYTSKE